MNDEEKRTHASASTRRWYWSNLETARARSRESSRQTNVNLHKPDGNCRPLIKRVRVKCLLMGGDPGSTDDVKMAILEVGYESPELQRNHFHPDFLSRTAGQWAWSWRNTSDKFKNKLVTEVDLLRVDLAQFEPLQPEQHD